MSSQDFLIQKLKEVFENISDSDCKLLLEEYGDNDNGKIDEITLAICEELETSRFTILDLIWNLRFNPGFGLKQKDQSLDGETSRNMSWSMARSKSSNTINRRSPTLGIEQPRSNSVAAQYEPPNTSSIAYSGTQHPIEITRVPKGMDVGTLRQYLSTYLQDRELRNLLYDCRDNKVPTLILIRGASGSGKSTLSSIIWAISGRAEICSADSYFINRNGQYNFNPTLLQDAHRNCRTRCKTVMDRGDSPIIIDNTNTRVDEMLPYVEMAITCNYDIRLVEPNTDWKRSAGKLAQKSTHGVPKKTIENQLDRFEKTTVQHLIDIVRKRKGGKDLNYHPHRDLDWGLCSTDKQNWQPPNFQPPEQLNELGRKKGASHLPPPLSPIAQWSFAEPPASGSTSPKVSDFIPDLTDTSGGTLTPKCRRTRSGKRNKSGNGNGTSNVDKEADKTMKPLVPFEDPAHQLFEKLCKYFPAAPRKEIEEIFNKMDGNLDNCATALLEEGYTLADKVQSPVMRRNEDIKTMIGLSSQLTRSNLDQLGAVGGMSDTDAWLAQSTANNDELLYQQQIHGIPRREELERRDEGCSNDHTFELKLPPHVARQLLGAYGHPEDENRNLSEDDLKVKLEPTVAFEIYKCLYLNIHKTENETSQSTRSNSPMSYYDDEDELNAVAISLSQMELEASGNQEGLAAIMDLETQKARQAQEALKYYTAPYRTMAQNVTFSMLKQKYPTLDPAIVDGVYCQCHLDVEKTTKALDEIAPQASAQFRRSPETPVETNWRLKYNPADVKLYSPDVIKKMQAECSMLEERQKSIMAKIKSCQDRFFSEGNPQVKSHYMTQIKEWHAEVHDVVDQMQYYKAVHRNSKHKNDHNLDLHGLTSTGAIRVLKDFLEFKKLEFANLGIPKMVLLIITGQGKHSKNGYPVLQPAVANYLKQKNYTFHPGQPGTFIVLLTRGDNKQ